jgi:hypothetical protein
MVVVLTVPDGLLWLSPPPPFPIIGSGSVRLLLESEADYELKFFPTRNRARDFVPVNSKIDMDPKTKMDLIGKSHTE